MKWYKITVLFLMSLVLLISGYANADIKKDMAKDNPTVLIIKKVPITVHGKASEVFRIEQPDGTWGYRGTKGDYFNVIVRNETNEPTVLHWHGLLLPNNQDGVGGVTQPVIPPGGEYRYNFKLKQAGTYWMHSHHGYQLQELMSAPLIINDPHNPVDQLQDVTIFLTDFSFKSPKTIYTQLKTEMSMHAHGHSEHAGHGAPAAMDLNDVRYDAYLTNSRVLSQPDVISVQPGSTVRLRFTNAAGASNFFIHLGKLQGTLIAVDGEAIYPIKDSQFEIVMGQRMDIIVNLPTQEGAYPILAQVEGTNSQTGLILQTPKAQLPILSEKAATVAGAVGTQQEMKLKPIKPLKDKPITKTLLVNLEGTMDGYVWKINGKQWPEYTPLEVKKGDRVEMVFQNETDMAHPMHLHGHVFEVREINGKALKGAMRDTVYVPARGTVKVQFDAEYPGNWMIHCHVLYHGEGGMMTILNYKEVPLPVSVAH